MTVDTTPCAAAFHPAVAEAAHRAGAEAVGVVDLGAPGPPRLPKVVIPRPF